ncbi:MULTISPECIES: bacterioferritin-associated ferredoxin [unclassified Thioalkalivibrio]|uniref:(2Fe-2S)-binding protein n=1 Tax=unclassified Thioalkalivibrio TaxID=2621013 RepID=UPI000476E365|nr:MULTISPECIES: (2Fe-2S)-binding protein [unclassified Thioalkalivibrio]
MIVCVCRAVREREILELVESSERGLRMRDLRERLGVSSECGKCARKAQCLLRQRAESFAMAGTALAGPTTPHEPLAPAASPAAV